MTKTRQTMFGGVNNQQAGGDINNRFFNNNFPIRFYEKDLRDLIVLFNNNTLEINAILDDFKRPTLVKKNEINNLSSEYFALIEEKHMHNFDKITKFLNNHVNKKYLELYTNIIEELQIKITIHREKFEKFEEIFDALYNYVIENSSVEINFERSLIWLFLHYMYCECHIGKKGEGENR